MPNYDVDDQIEVEFLIENQHQTETAILAPETSISISHWGLEEPVFAYSFDEYSDHISETEKSGGERTATKAIGLIGGSLAAAMGIQLGDAGLQSSATDLISQSLQADQTFDELDAIVDDKILTKMGSYLVSGLVLEPGDHSANSVSLGTYEDKDIEIDDRAPFFIMITVNFSGSTKPDVHVFEFNRPES